MNETIRIFLADDHAILRESLCALLSSEGDLEVCGDAADGFTVERGVSECTPDVLILDISMPGKSGLDVAREVKRTHPEIAIVFLTMHRNEQMVAEAFEAGADGYVLKDNAFEELTRAIHDVHAGKRYVSPSLGLMLLGGFLENERAGRELSEREMEVLKLLAEGYSNKEISDMLSISVKTVETHRANIMRKHGFKNITELVLYAVRNHIIEI